MLYLDFKTIGSKIKERRVSLGLTQDFVATKLNVTHCSVDYFIGDEYTFHLPDAPSSDLDEQIQKKLNYCSNEKKERILKMIDLL